MPRLLLLSVGLSLGSVVAAQDAAGPIGKVRPSLALPDETDPQNLSGDLVIRKVSMKTGLPRYAKAEPRDNTCYTIRSHNFDESDAPQKQSETTCVRAQRGLLKRTGKSPAR